MTDDWLSECKVALSLTMVLWLVGFELWLSLAGSETHGCVSGLRHHVLMHQVVDLFNWLLASNAAHLLMLRLLNNLITALNVLIHEVVPCHLMLTLWRSTTRQSAYCVVLTARWKLVIPRIYLHVVHIVILVDEGLLFALLLQLLVRLLTLTKGGTESNSGWTCFIVA